MSDMSDDDDQSDQPNGEEYVVEKVIGKRTLHGNIEYFIKWKGWEDSDNTWEPIDHLGNCQDLIQTYESSVQNKPKKKATRARGRKPSNKSTPSSARSSASRSTRKSSSTTLYSESVTNSFGSYSSRKDKNKLCDYQSDDEFSLSEVEDEDTDLPFEVLFICPPGKDVQKIHAVTVVDGYLSFLVQWKNSIEDHPASNCLTNGTSRRPPISARNANIVRATAMNTTFPQEVIEFYQRRIQFNISLNTQEEEAKNAARALLQAKEREAAAILLGNDDNYVDAATVAIEREERRRDKFNANPDDLSTDSDELHPSSDDD